MQSRSLIFFLKQFGYPRITPLREDRCQKAQPGELGLSISARPRLRSFRATPFQQVPRNRRGAVRDFVVRSEQTDFYGAPSSELRRLQNFHYLTDPHELNGLSCASALSSPSENTAGKALGEMTVCRCG